MSILKNHINAQSIKTILAPEDKVIDAINVMYANDKSYVIIQKNNKTLGIFTQGDLKNRVVAKNLDSNKTTLSDVMTCDLDMLDINDSLSDCLSKIEMKKIDHLPVLSNGKLVVVSQIGLLQLAFNEVSIEREELIHYINGQIC